MNIRFRPLRSRTIFSQSKRGAVSRLISSSKSKIGIHDSFRCLGMASQVQPVFSSNYSPTDGRSAIAPLLRASGGRWSLTESGKGLERSFRFKTFKKTWAFMNEVAKECTVQKHHPEWSNVYNTTFIRWTTHSPPGLSEKDVRMANYCDQQAEAYEELAVETNEESGKDLGKELADRVANEGGDCCVPKKKSETAREGAAL